MKTAHAHPLCQNGIENQFRHIGRISLVLVPRTKLQSWV